MKRAILGAVIWTLTSSASAGILLDRKPVYLQIAELGKEIDESGYCAATDKILLCILDYPFRAIRVTDSVSRRQEGTWEAIAEPNDPRGPDGNPEIRWVRVCISGSCEVWPRSVFFHKLLP